MKNSPSALDVLAAGLGALALLVAGVALLDRDAVHAWFAPLAATLAIALFVAATPARGRWWRAAALLATIPAVTLMGFGLALVLLGPSADSASWAPVVFGWGCAAFGASFGALALTALSRSHSARMAGIGMAVAAILGAMLVPTNDLWLFVPLAVVSLAFQIAVVLTAARALRPAEVTMVALFAEASATGWLAYLVSADRSDAYDAAAVTLALGILAGALVVAAVIAVTGGPLLRALARIPVFAAATAVAMLLSLDDRFPGEEAMLLVAGAAFVYAYVIGHPRHRRLLPVVELLALPAATLVLFTEVPGFGLALALAAAIFATEWRSNRIGPRGHAGARA